MPQENMNATAFMWRTVNKILENMYGKSIDRTYIEDV